jgi:RNA polymerase primary sigma factor
MHRYKSSAAKAWRERSARAAVSAGGKRVRTKPSTAVVTKVMVPLNEEAKQAIYSSFYQGVSLATLAQRFHRTTTTVRRVINEVRARRLLAKPVDYIYNPDFDKPALEAEITAPMPRQAEYEASRAKARASVPKGLAPELAALYETPLLARDQEAHLFRQMNFFKHKAARLLRRIDPTRARAADLDQIEEYLAQAQRAKEQLICANMRLVVSVTKKYAGPHSNFFEMLSDGNLSLMRAVEKFDYSRGNKFSTYATWALMNNFARGRGEEKTARDRFLTGCEEIFEFASDSRGNEHEALASAERAQQQANRLLDQLTERERTIVRLRNGLDAERGMTLAQVGEELGITKERVRQLELRAMAKLRTLAAEQQLDIA